MPLTFFADYLGSELGTWLIDIDSHMLCSFRFFVLCVNFVFQNIYVARTLNMNTWTKLPEVTMFGEGWTRKIYDDYLRLENWWKMEMDPFMRALYADVCEHNNCEGSVVGNRQNLLQVCLVLLLTCKSSQKSLDWISILDRRGKFISFCHFQYSDIELRYLVIARTFQFSTDVYCIIFLQMSYEFDKILFSHFTITRIRYFTFHLMQWLWRTWVGKSPRTFCCPNIPSKLQHWRQRRK